VYCSVLQIYWERLLEDIYKTSGDVSADSENVIAVESIDYVANISDLLVQNLEMWRNNW